MYISFQLLVTVYLYKKPPPPRIKKGLDRAFEHTLSRFLPTYRHRPSYTECRRRIVEQLTCISRRQISVKEKPTIIWSGYIYINNIL